MKIHCLCLFTLHLAPVLVSSQPSGHTVNDGLAVLPDSRSAAQYRPLQFFIDPEKTLFVRMMLWHQQWVTTGNLSNPAERGDFHHLIRRSRFLAYAKLHPDVLILTHWGLNNLDAASMNALGNDGDGPQLFLHDAFTEFRISNELFVGGGLHYYRGLTRLTSESTLNFLSMDQTRPFAHWPSLGITDQFIRHMGMYAKGEIGRAAYRVSWNNPMRKPLNEGKSYGDRPTEWVYNSINIPRSDGSRAGNTLLEGYANYFFLDRESTALPYWVGTHLGTKNVFNLGGGFLWQKDGMVSVDSLRRRNVSHVALDVFADLPAGADRSITTYASVIRYNYGRNYVSRWSGTGWNLFVQSGMYFKRLRLMPYAAVQVGLYEGLKQPVTAVDAGINRYIMDHHAKITLEYHAVRGFAPEGGRNLRGDPRGLSQVRFQMHVFF